MSVRKTFLDTLIMSSTGMIRMLAQFLAIPILSRLLSPEEYGLVAMAMPFVLFAILFSDAGFGQSLVRVSREERVQWSTCFWLTTILGIVLMLLIAGLGVPFSHMMGEPRLIPIIASLSLILLMQALSSVPGAALQQAGHFRVIATIEIISIACGIGSAVLVAMSGFGPWALVAQQLVMYGLRSVMTVGLSPFRPLMVCKISQVHDHVHFGKDVIAIHLCNYANRALDSVIVGGILGAAAAGTYVMTMMFARLPVQVISGPLDYVLYSRLASVRDNIVLVRKMFLLFSRGLAMLIVPAMGMIAVAHEPVFTLLLSEKWQASGQLFAIVGPVAGLHAVVMLCSVIMLVLGQSRLRLRVAAEQAVYWLTVLTLFSRYGLEVAAYGYLISILLYLPRVLRATLPLIDCSHKEYWAGFTVPVVITGLSAASYLFWAPIVVDVIWQFLLAAGLGVLAFALIVGLQYNVLKQAVQAVNQEM